MKRSIVALILCSVLVGLWAVAAAAAGTGEDASRQLVSIHVRDADISDVVQTVMTYSGANIVLDEGVQGKITVDGDDLSVERVLGIICDAKGFFWWRANDAYFLSTRPQSPPDPAKFSLPGLSKQRDPDRISKMYTLRFMPPQYIAYLFGTADDPGLLNFSEPNLGDVGSALMRPTVGAGIPSPSGSLGELGAMGGGGRGGGGGGGFGGGGGGGFGGGGGAAFVDLLPEGIEQMIAYAPLNALLIQGTEESVNKLIELLKLLDRKPQQIIIELQSVEVSTNQIQQMGVDWYYIAGNTRIEPAGMSTAYSLYVGYTPSGFPNFAAVLTYLLEKGGGRLVDAIRVATMNLMPAVNQVVIDFPWVTVGGIQGDVFRGTNIQTLSVQTISIPTVLTIVPKINGDGTITLAIPYTKSAITGTVPVPSQYGSIEYPIITSNMLNTTVNVRDGETFVLGGFVNENLIWSERRLPILGNLPIIGDLLFTRRSRALDEKETLIFITPRIIKEEAAPATLGPI